MNEKTWCEACVSSFGASLLMHNKNVTVLFP